MNKPDWIRIAPVTDIPVREGRAVKIGDLEVAIFNLGSDFVAIENRCPHKGGPLADGIVSTLGDSVTVTCPLHNWRVCIDTGAVRKPSAQNACVRTFAVRIKDGLVMISKAPAAAEQEAAA